MCGLAGFLTRGGADLEETVLRMGDTLRHRGPDAFGVWADPAAGIALAHRRLSILDVSEAGHQPMWSEDGKWVIVFNGEIYNFGDLQRELLGLGCKFRGHSDTEVMLAAFQAWGVDRALGRFNGMFAFALWNVESRTLYLGRDRLGKKPLYYGWLGDTLAFGSELKALRAHPKFSGEIDSHALTLYLKRLYIPAPYSIYRGIFKLPGGTFLKISEAAVGATYQPTPYWSALDIAQRNRQQPFQSASEGEEELESLLKDAVKRRMVADVPLGAFLSGGIDSSLVVALMQAQSAAAVRTFTIGFRERTHNEAVHARSVAEHLGTAHTELYVTPEEAMDVIPLLPEIYDEPFADPSQIPTYLVSKLAHESVTVSLSGDGGDELFAGYEAYSSNARFKAKYGNWPIAARRSAAWGIRRLSAPMWDSIVGPFSAAEEKHLRAHTVGERLHGLANALTQTTDHGLHQALVSPWHDAECALQSADSQPEPEPQRTPEGYSFVESMMYLDTMTYLPDDILVKVDRASMAVSLEARCPLLDYRVVELAWRMPLSQKMDEGGGKAPLRRILHRYVPKTLVDRPKSGFGVPIGDWLRGPLEPWTSELLRPERLKNDGILNPGPITRLWDQHRRGEADWRFRLWAVLMLQSWLEHSKSTGQMANCSARQMT